MYRFKIPIGDWSDDGHGKHEDYLIESNKPVEYVRELYFSACDKIGFSLDGSYKQTNLTPNAEYEDFEFSKETLQALLDFGVKLDDKSSLFKTEDGVDVFIGDSPWCTLSNTECEGFKDVHQFKNITENSTRALYKYFSTKEKAEEYVRLNTVLFTTNDGVNVKMGDIYYYIELQDDEYSYIIMERTASSKDTRLINKHKDIVAFSTRKAAKQYIFLNKPCLSLADVASVYVTANQPVDCTTRKDAQNRRIQDLVKQKLNL